MNAALTYLKHVREEFTHIVWPTRRTAMGHLLVVVFIAIIMALVITLLDRIFALIVSKIIVG